MYALIYDEHEIRKPLKKVISVHKTRLNDQVLVLKWSIFFLTVALDSCGNSNTTHKMGSSLKGFPGSLRKILVGTIVL